LVVGIVKINLYDSIMHTIQEVLYMKDSKENLLSIDQSNDFGCNIHIEGKILKVVKENLVIMRV